MNSSNGPFGNFYEGKKVLVTGDTGFKGSWLCLWLKELGADVIGLGLEPGTSPSLFSILKLGRKMDHTTLDIRDYSQLENFLKSREP